MQKGDDSTSGTQFDVTREQITAVLDFVAQTLQIPFD
jgi:hypothetical protein